MSAQPPTTVQVDPDLVRPTWSRGWAGVAIVSAVLCVLALVVGGVAAFAAGFSTLPTYDARATATVTGLSREHYTEPDYSPCGPRYAFTVDGVRYTGTSPNVDEKYCSFAAGDTIDITYEPAHPETYSAPAAHYTTSTALAVGCVIAAGVLLVLSVTSVVVAVRRKR